MTKVIQVLALCFLCSSAFAQTKDIIINISGFKSDKGKCIIYLFKNKKGFPTETDKAVKSISGKISGRKCILIIKDIVMGEYAISAIHDENDNGKMDADFFGIPKEGLGTSNNAQSFDGPPSFNDSKFQFIGNNQVNNINIKYL